MNNSKRLGFLLLFSLSTLFGVVLAQEKSFEAMNPEEQFNLVQSLAYSGEYETARGYGKKVLDSIPNYHDVTLMVARTFMWEQLFDSARVYINKVVGYDPDNQEAKMALIDLAYFEKNMQQVEQLAPELIKNDPDNIVLREKYAVALMANEQEALAGSQADSILMQDSINVIALDIKNQLTPKNKPIEITVGYSFDHFSKPYTRWWHLYTGGARKEMKWGSLEGRINVGHLSAIDSIEAATEWQLEAESYINLTKSAYAMVLYGYSPYDHFPTHKTSLEVWHLLPASMAASLGGSYYNWGSSHNFIGTASLEKYWNKYWFCLRGYAYFKDIGIKGSYYFTARRYFNDIDFFQLTLGTGTAPDEPFDIKTDLQRLSATSIRCMLLKKVAPKWKLRAGLGYAYEEYFDDLYRNRFDGTVSFIYSLGR